MATCSTIKALEYQHQYHFWLTQCAKLVTKTKCLQKNILLAYCAIYLQTHQEKIKSKKYRNKRHRIHSNLRQRNVHGVHSTILPAINLNKTKYKDFLRMTPMQFEELLSLVGPFIVKKQVTQESIPPAIRLALSLRYLATGDNVSSLSYNYLIEPTTANDIIHETCKALWNCLCKKVLPYPLKTEDWLKISDDFEHLWDFNLCIGAIAAKQVVIQCPDDIDAAQNHNQHNHSIVLLGMCNAKYMFTFVDIGPYGRSNDGGIFRESTLGQKFTDKQMNIPNPVKLTVDGNTLPYVLVGDEAFQLSDYLLRPYPSRSNLTQEQILFNNRLNRARKTIDSTFGIVVSRWRILKKPIETSVDNAVVMLQAITCLHNWLCQRDSDNNEYISANLLDRDTPSGTISGHWKEELINCAFEKVGKCGANNSSRAAKAIRDEFCDFFNAKDAVSV